MPARLSPQNHEMRISLKLALAGELSGRGLCSVFIPPTKTPILSKCPRLFACPGPVDVLTTESTASITENCRPRLGYDASSRVSSVRAASYRLGAAKFF